MSPEFQTPILIVDDDAIFREVAIGCLTAAGLDAVGAGDGLEALRMIRKRSFSLLVVDLDMPRVDGFRLIGLVRATWTCARMPIIVASVSQKFRDRSEAFSLGVTEFLSKPLDWSTFPHVAAEAIERSSRRKPAPRHDEQHLRPL